MAFQQKDIDIQDKTLNQDDDFQKDLTLDKDIHKDRNLDKDINEDRDLDTDKNLDKDINEDRDLDTDKNLDTDKDVTDEAKEGKSTASVIKDTVMQIGQKGVELGQKGVELVKDAYNVVADKLANSGEPVEHDEACDDKDNCKGCSKKDSERLQDKHEASCKNQECEGCVAGIGPAALSSDPLGKDLQKQLGNGLDADMGTNDVISDKGHDQGINRDQIGNRDQLMGDIHDSGRHHERNVDQDLPKPIDRQDDIPSNLAGAQSYAGVVREQEQRLPSDIHADQLKDLGHGRNVQI